MAAAVVLTSRPARRRVSAAVVIVLMVGLAFSFTRLKNLATGRNPCGHRPVPANVIGNLGDTVTVLSSKSVDLCTTAHYATVPEQIYTIESRSADLQPVASVEAAITSSGWRTCPWQPEGGCVQASDRHYHAILVAQPDRTVSVIVFDARNKYDCSKGCG